MELPVSNDFAPLALVSETGDRYELPANVWKLFCWMGSTLGGWRPTGTEPPKNWGRATPWSRAYDVRSGQIMTASDAAALANSLNHLTAMFQHVLKLSPEHVKEALNDELSPNLSQQLVSLIALYGPGAKPGRDLSAMMQVEEVISICRKGALTIGP